MNQNKYKKFFIILSLTLFINFIHILYLNSMNPLSAPFSTKGNQIINSKGENIRIIGVNWFGFQTSTQCPHGLWERGYKDLMNQIKSLGFNTIRLPINNQMFDASAQISKYSIDFALNPDLRDLKPIQILDKVVTYADQIGIYIFLDHHRSGIGDGPNENGLWYTSQYPESRFIQDWQMLAKRYLNNKCIIGADLHNEPYGSATWGSGNVATDWKAAAQKTGNAILSVNPNWLIIIEGIETYNNNSYWWGGNLMGVKNAPVVLNVSNKVVYSPHDYANSAYPQKWFYDSNFPNNLPKVFRDNWGYIFEQNIAPILLGEFGSKIVDPKDIAWIAKLTAYLNGDFTGTGKCTISSSSNGLSWSYWSMNANSSVGILNSDWKTTDKKVLNAIAPIMVKNPCSTEPAPTPTGSCLVDYQMISQWSDGFVGNIIIHNKGTQPITNWKLQFSFLGNQRIVNIWNGKFSVSSDNKITITNESWNATIPAGAKVSIGFQAVDNGLNRTTTTFALNGMVCSA